MKILMPYFAVTGKASYPDLPKFFSDMSEINFNTTPYWLCEYIGEMSLETGADTYADYKASLPSSSTIDIQTIDWLRTHLTSSIEYTVRVFSKGTHANAPDVAAFMMMIDARINLSLIVSDDDYAFGIKTLFDVGLLTQEHATALLLLGEHDVNTILGI